MTTTTHQQGESVDLDRLEELAKAATQGEWKWDGRREDADGYVYIPECSYLVGGIALAYQHEGYQADCDFMAAANPSTILKLIAQARASQPATSDAQPVGADDRGWFDGAEDCDGNPLVLVRADELKTAIKFICIASLSSHRIDGDMLSRSEFAERLESRAALATPAASGQAGATVAAEPFPERDLSKPAEQQGMFRKFDVRRIDGSDQPGGKHFGCRYYVLDLTHDQHAPAAMRAYAAACRSTHPQLADDIEREFAAAPASPATQQAVMDAARDATRYRFIEEHATMHGGGNGFTITCFVGADEEDMGVGIDRMIAAMSASVSEADGSGKGGA